MLTAVKGYYNGSQIVMEEQPELTKGQQVIITILDDGKGQQEETSTSTKKMLSGMKQFRAVIGDNKGWASEEDMIKDMADFRRKRAGL